MSVNVRAYVLQELALPPEWRQIEEQRIPEVIDRETVIVKHSGIRKLKEAPISHLEHEVILAVFIPNRDLARAEARLDDAVLELIAAIDGHRSIGWSEATKVVTPGNTYPGWELTLTVPTEPDTTPPESEI